MKTLVLGTSRFVVTTELRYYNLCTIIMNIRKENMVKKTSRLLLLLSLLFYITASFSSSHKQLHSYTEILNALSHGSHLQVISKLKDCTPSSTDNIQLSSVEFNHFVVYTSNTNGQKSNAIGMSNTIAVHPKLGDTYKYVSEYIRIHILKNGLVEMFHQYLNPDNSLVIAPKTDVDTYTCQLDKGIQVYEL